ncbi:MAG: hypothetical protein LAT63_11960 [Marinobacter sp.]|nr:hypothetical protein [Marinobacter sp.]
MNRLTRLLVPSLAGLLLAGCGEESTPRPTDGRTIDGVYTLVPGTYAGRVIDGYLSNARVWLDLDGDYQYTEGPVEVTLPNGRVVIIEGGEPTALTDEQGRFVLDTSVLIRDPDIEPSIDARNYPLVAVAVPGMTEMQTYHGLVPVTSAFQLSAAPGVRNITPLTSLLDSRRNLTDQPLTVANSSLARALAGVNLLGDYMATGDDRGYAYARALARFMASQYPQTVVDALLTSEGRARVLADANLNLLRLSFLSNAEAIISLVDDAATGGYANVDVDSLDLPEVPLDLDDPVILRTQIVRAQPSENNSLPVGETGLRGNQNISAELTFDYSPRGELLEVSVTGCMEPDMAELARLINAEGRISEALVQWLPQPSLAAQSRIFYESGEVNERLTFDWEASQIHFDTTTTCIPGLAASSALGGTPARTYSWTLDNDGRVASITDGSLTLTPSYGNANPVIFGYELRDAQQNLVGGRLADLGIITECAVNEDDVQRTRVISAQQDYAFNHVDMEAPQGFAGLKLDWDTRDGQLRLLRKMFLAPEIDPNAALEWEFAYGLTPDARVEDQPNLISTAHLSRLTNASQLCGVARLNLSGSNVYTIVNYEYSRLSSYLAEGF